MILYKNDHIFLTNYRFTLIPTKKCLQSSFFRRNKCYEVDFIIQKGKEAVPIEVKAEENLKSKSLKVYVDKYKPGYTVRTAMSNSRKQEWMVNIPLWAIQSV